MNIRIIRQSVICSFMLFLALVLAGCGNTKSNNPPITQTQVTPRPKPTLTIQATITPTKRPSATTRPSETIDLTWAAISIRRASTEDAKSTSSQATSEAVSTLRAQFPDSCEYYQSILLSPDGNWLAVDCGGFQVLSRNGHKNITISNDKVSPPNAQVANSFPIGWSNDSQYVYFSTYICCVDTDAYSIDGPLYRVDVQSATWAKVIDGYFNYYSFSPTGRRLLHIPLDLAGHGNPVKFQILDLKSGTEQLIRLDGFEQAGQVLWSPDGRSFVTTAKIGNIYAENQEFSLFLVSLDDLSVVNIIPISKNDVYATRWSSDNILTIIDAIVYCYVETMICDKTLLYDVKAKQFITASPTP